MTGVSFTLPAHSFRALPTPLDSQGMRTYICVVPASGIPSAFANWLDVNAREASLKGRVPKSIRATLVEEPEHFAAFNRGLAVLASSVTYDNKSHEVTVHFVDKKLHGVFDGGHTLAVILSQREDQGDEAGDAAGEAHCRVEVMTGVPEDLITDLVEARNTSRQVASKSLDNLAGRFDSLKVALGTHVADLVSWKENEEAPIDAREVVALMTALDATHYNDEQHPLVAYSGKEACLKHFENNRSCYDKLASVVPDILRVWEEIQAVVPEQHYREGGRFGQYKGCDPLKNPRSLPVTGSTTKWPFPSAYLYPIVAAFRSMLVEDGGVFRWGKGVNPCALVRGGLANKIFGGPIVNSIRSYHNPNRTGKDTNVWALAYQIAENHYLRL